MARQYQGCQPFCAFANKIEAFLLGLADYAIAAITGYADLLVGKTVTDR